MQQQHSGQHLMGQKQYELTNHLGNVQVTVSDLPYKHGNDTIARISPALKAVYDYYPFGSPMPGRTIMDTARKCVDMTRLDRVWKAWEMTQAEIYLQCLINYHLDGEGKVFIDDYGAVEVEIADEYAVFYMDLQDSLNNGGEMVLHIDWLKEFSEKGFLLTLQGMDATGEMRVFYQKHYEKPEDAVYLNIADSFTNISVGIQGNVHFRIDNIRYTGGSWVNEEVLVRVCDDGGDRYRFGFNGQEKVNEMSGMGNHNTAEFWEYDTRLGRRWNLDPVDQISVSNYAVNGNNPIWAYDYFGNFDSERKAKDYKKENKLKGRIVSSKDEGVNYQIRNKNYTYFQDPTSPSMGVDGVTKAYNVTGKKWKSTANSYTAWMRDPALIESGAYKRAYQYGYMPPFLIDGFGVSGSLGAGGFTAEGEGSIGLYADRNGNFGGVASTEGGVGLKSPGLVTSISFDFYNYGRNLDIDHLTGPNITTSLQLGIIGFSYTQSTDKKLRPNNQLNIFSISFGLRGLGFTQKMGASGYLGTKKNDKNEKEEQ